MLSLKTRFGTQKLYIELFLEVTYEKNIWAKMGLLGTGIEEQGEIRCEIKFPGDLWALTPLPTNNGKRSWNFWKWKSCIRKRIVLAFENNIKNYLFLILQKTHVDVMLTIQNEAMQIFFFLSNVERKKI